jgi:chromate transporter
MDALGLFAAVLNAAALSVGGLSSLPLLREQLVVPGYVTERQVIEALAIGRLSTGPNGLYVVSLGYFALGWLGAAVALVAATIPPLSMVVLAALVRRWLLRPWAAGIVRGVALSTSGLTLATAVGLIAPGRPFFAVQPWELGLAAAGTVLGIQGKVHPGLLVAGGALAGVLIAR